MRRVKIRQLLIVSAAAVVVVALGGGASSARHPDRPAALGVTGTGIDSPSVLFYSSNPASGHRAFWSVTLPKDPPATVRAGRSWSFELLSDFWFGVATCDSQSYPQQTSVCTPDSDSNIKRLARHAGTAYLQVQFFPPGWVPLASGVSCSPTRWCAAMTIVSVSEDPVNGTALNPTCTAQVLGGIDYENFAFLTRNGKPTGPPNPLHFNPLTSGFPDPKRVLFMKPGDQITLTIRDTASGVNASIHDGTTGQNGSMTASAGNKFGHIEAAPGGTSCTNLPYSFHAMYSTSSPKTRVPWAAHSYNIAMGFGIGGFDYCTAAESSGFCGGLEGASGDQEPSDSDEMACFDAASSSLVRVSGCTSQNFGFDGTSYQRDWPDGNKVLHPTPVLLSSPLTGPTFKVNYRQVAIEADTPAIEQGTCNRITGTGCTVVPTTDDGVSAAFYPFFSVTRAIRARACRWFLGGYVPGLTAGDFGGVFQYGSLLSQPYLAFGGHGATVNVFNVFRQKLAGNPCPARSR